MSPSKKTILLKEESSSDLEPVKKIINGITSVLTKKLEKAKRLKIFSISDDSFLFEKELLNTFGKKIDIVRIESQKTVYEKRLKVIKQDNLNIDLHNKSFQDYCSSTKIKFDLIWLNYLSSWNNKKGKSFFSMLENNRFNFSNGNPFIAVNAIDDFPGVELLLFDRGTNNEGLADLTLSGLPKYLNEMANGFNFTLKPVGILRYVDRIKKVYTEMAFNLFMLEKGIIDYYVYKSSFREIQEKLHRH